MNRERSVDPENLQCSVVCRYRFATMRRYFIAPHTVSGLGLGLFVRCYPSPPPPGPRLGFVREVGRQDVQITHVGTDTASPC